jgi:hypothetical protein
MPATYEPIATTTLGAAATSITFSTIPATYTDLRLVIVPIANGGSDYNLFVQLNGVSAAEYSKTRITGDGSSATSGRAGGSTKWNLIGPLGFKSTPSFWTLDIFSYAGSTHKQALSSGSNDLNGTGNVDRAVHRWENTAAINQIVISGDISNNFNTGTTATLYGILKA